MRRWIRVLLDRRAPCGPPPFALTRRRLYILPTRSGGVFALVLLVMLLGATNYSNSLAFALTFWLAAIALVSMHRAHRNLIGLEVTRVTARPVTAGETAWFELGLAVNARRQRRALRVVMDNAAVGEIVDVGARAPNTLYVPAPARGRGWQRCPAFILQSVYPMGLFRAWSRLRPEAWVLAYPRAAGDPAWPRAAAGTARRATASPAGRDGDELRGHRQYHAGDTPRHIDWKATARSDDLMVREYAHQTAPDLWFDEAELGTLELEAKLSQLALWVHRAAETDRRYGLRLAGHVIGPARGHAHRRACLEALALF